MGIATDIIDYVKAAKEIMEHKKRLLIPVCCAIAMFSMFAIISPTTNAADVPLKIQAAIFIKILGYDSSIAAMPGNKIVINVLTDSKTASNKKDISAAFSSINGAAVSGKKISIKFITAGGLPGASGVIYLPSGSSKSTVNMAVVHGASKKVRILAGSRQLAVKGAAVAVSLENSKPKIIVNLKQSKAMGMKLSTQLLKLATII